MRRFDVRWVPLMIAAGAFVGSALVSSVAVANDEPPMIDQPELVVEPAAEAPAPAIPSPSDEESTDTIDIGQGDEDIVSGEAPDPSFDDIVVVEMVMPDAETAGDTAAPDDEPTADTAPPDPEMEAAAAETTLAETASAMATPVDPAAPIGEPELGTPPVAEEPGEGHEEGHEGGSGGQGNPYRMTFTVIWLDPDGTPIAVLDAAFPGIDWRSMFELSAASETGKGMPTSATCTYPDGSEVLRCVFDNPGHGSGADGLIVPARPTATYTVTVTWPLPPDWTIENANGGPYFARATSAHVGAENPVEAMKEAAAKKRAVDTNPAAARQKPADTNRAAAKKEAADTNPVAAVAGVASPASTPSYCDSRQQPSSRRPCRPSSNPSRRRSHRPCPRHPRSRHSHPPWRPRSRPRSTRPAPVRRPPPRHSRFRPRGRRSR